MKKLINILFWAAIIVYYFVAMGFVSERQSEQIVTDLKINVLDSARSRFVTTDDILQMVENSTQKMRGVLFDSIDIPMLEQRLMTFPPVRRVDIFKTINGAVHINVTQRTPIVRVINRYGESFFLDERGEMLKHSNRYSAHVLVANGYINFRPGQENYNVMTAEHPAGRRNIMLELFELANFINDDRFWQAQIQQIYVNEEGEFELIPMVGAHVIVFGKFENPEIKFSRLKTFYQNGLSVKGWNTYQIINLKYEGQVVATKR